MAILAQGTHWAVALTLEFWSWVQFLPRFRIVPTLLRALIRGVPTSRNIYNFTNHDGKKPMRIGMCVY